MVKKIKTARVHWKDIATISDINCAWYLTEDAVKKGKEVFLHDHLTIGEIIENNKDFILVASTINTGESPMYYSDISMIPKSVITKIDYFK